MSCAAGYPRGPCPFKFEGRVTRETCGPCKFFVPPVHILTWCMLWDRDHVLCMRPKKDCETCPEKYRGPPLNKAMAKIDWSDHEQVKAYYRELYARDPSKVNARMLRFLEKKPDYFQKYRERNKAKMNAAALRYYHRKKKNEPNPSQA